MFAVVVQVALIDEEAARRDVAERVVPGVRQLTGAQNGYWLEPQQDQGMSFVIFDTEENARQAADTVPTRVPPSVTLKSVEIREVIAGF